MITKVPRRVRSFSRPERSARAIRRYFLSVELVEQRALLSTLVGPDAGTLLTATVAISYQADAPPPPPPDPEGTMTSTPQSVSGAYLTDGAEADPGYDKPMSFDKVIQGQSDTCVFTSTLSAVALSNFDLSSGITIGSKKSSTDYVFDVRVYEPVGATGLAEIEIPVEFDGTINQSDARSTDPNEFWPTLYQRAFLAIESINNRDYHDPMNAFEALTGQPAQLLAGPAMSGSIVTPSWLAQKLNAGSPVTAQTIATSDPYTLDPAHGIIGEHSYTVLGVEIPSSGALDSTFITLRNPWGMDTTPQIFAFSGNSELDAAQYAKFQQGLDGNNDGVIRIPWSVFGANFKSVAFAQITGASINTALIPPPTFKNPVPGPITIYAGQTVGPIDLSASDPRGRAIYYHTAATDLGTVDASGQYSWSTLPGATGTFYVTVVAQSQTDSSASATFTVNVLPDTPVVASITASPTSFNVLGTQLVTLTAQGVSDPAGPVDRVTFWLDTPGEGSFDQSRDYYLGAATAATSWAWSGYIGGISPAPPGTVAIFAVADRTVQGYTVESDAATTDVTITPGPAYSVVAIPWIDQVQASPDSSDAKVAVATTEDAAGNTRVFWEAINTQRTFFEREYDPFGHPLTAPIELNTFQGLETLQTFVGLASGAFDGVYSDGSTLDVQRYDAAGSPLGSPIVIDPNGANDSSIAVAADSSGDLLIAFEAGPDYSHYQIFAATLSASGAVTGPSAISTDTSGPQHHPTVALDAAGSGVIAWNDLDQSEIVARTVTGAGASEGSVFTVYQDPSVKYYSATVDAAVDGEGVITLAYEGSGGIHASRYNADGTPAGGDFKVYTALGDVQEAPLVAATSQGWFIIAWDEFSNGSPEVINAQVYDPEGRPQGSPFLVPNVVIASTLGGLAFGNDGKMAVAYTQVGVNDPNHLVADFRLYRVDFAPVFQGSYHFTVPVGSAVGTVVGTAQAIDPDRSPVAYELQGSSPFAVDYQTGQITVADASALQSTAVTNYELTVVADDLNVDANLRPVTNVEVTLIEAAPPTIAPIPDRAVDTGGFLGARFFGTDPAGAPLTYSAVAETLPYYLEQTYGLYEDPSGYNTGQRGDGEKYLRGKISSQGYTAQETDYAYYLLPSGDLYEQSLPYSATTLAGVKVASLGAAVYADPTLLTSAVNTLTPATVTVTGNVAIASPVAGFVGTFGIMATATDGLASVSRGFLVNVTAPALAAVPDQSFISHGSISLAGSDASGSALTYSAVAETVPYYLEQSLGLYDDPSGYNTGQRGAGEKYLRGKTSSQAVAPQGTDYWYYLLPNGDLYEQTPPHSATTLAGVKVASLGAAVYANPTLLTAATSAPVAAVITITNNVMNIAATGNSTGPFTVVASVSDGLTSAFQSFQVTLDVPSLTPKITWATPADITVGTPLGAGQLDATASVPGVFSYSPSLETVLKAGRSQTLSVTFTPTDAADYLVVTDFTTINVLAPSKPPRVTGIVSVTRSKKGLTAITVGFDEAIDSSVVSDTSMFSVRGAVKKHKRTVYSNRRRIQAISFDGSTHVTIRLAKPFKGALQVTIAPGIKAANGAASADGFTAIVR